MFGRSIIKTASKVAEKTASNAGRNLGSKKSSKSKKAQLVEHLELFKILVPNK